MFLQFERFRMVPMMLVMGTIFFLSHQPGDTLDIGYIPGIDKVAHFSIYALLALTVIFAHSATSRKRNILRVCLVTCIICLLYGISDEFHQSFIPGRFVSGADVVADMVGAVTACLVWVLSYRLHLAWGRNDQE